MMEFCIATRTLRTLDKIFFCIQKITAFILFCKCMIFIFSIKELWDFILHNCTTNNAQINLIVNSICTIFG